MLRRFLLLALAAALAVPVGAIAWLFWLPDVTALKKRPPETTAYIELRRVEAARKKKPFHLRWEWTPYDSISENLRDAVVMAEDDTFWRHGGVEWEALKEAGAKDWKEKRMAAGASTITMQLARNLYLSPSKNPLRKLKEILIAKRLEKTLGKRRILELYLNTVEWGKDLFGCEAAARAYFGKSAADLTPGEAVAMAVVLPNPRRWDAGKGGPYVERNSSRIIGRMIASGQWLGADVSTTTAVEAETGP
ncbi:MAG: monofunctional biosynthetic peptidoglycan transglycosylase [Elusimicrobia bacterium RIFOXYD12_FULL_66_9]|nr:MAG: monofunctional biosynthetic peptidoglycan transglycosylase [Elusimicrobia bacterium RIFOXYD12_FULL_66_9]